VSARQKYASAKAAPRHIATDHPNASTSGVTGALGICVVWTATTLGLPMDATAGAAFAAVITAGVLFIGRRAPWFRRTELEPALLDGDPDNPP
jgi:hypothetical protein